MGQSRRNHQALVWLASPASQGCSRPSDDDYDDDDDEDAGGDKDDDGGGHLGEHDTEWSSKVSASALTHDPNLHYDDHDDSFMRMIVAMKLDLNVSWW